MLWNRHLPEIVLVSVALLFPAGEVWAQAIDIPMLMTGTRGPDTWANAFYAHQFETNIDNTQAEFSRDNLSLVAGRRFQLSDDWFLVGNAAYQGSYYDFNKGTDLAPPGADGNAFLRWGAVHRFTLMAGAGWRASESWTLIGFLLGRTDAEGGADFDDTLSGGVVLGADYRWSETLSTGVLLGFMSVLEDDPAIIPIPTVDWRFADDWLFHFGVINAAAYPGIGPEISYRSGQWSAGFGGGFQVRRFRLDSDTGQPTNEGIGEERNFPVYARVGYAPNENMSFGILGGVSLGGQIRSGTNTGRKVFKEDYDPRPIIGAQASLHW